MYLMRARGGGAMTRTTCILFSPGANRNLRSLPRYGMGSSRSARGQWWCASLVSVDLDATWDQKSPTPSLL